MKTLDYYGAFGGSLGEKGVCPNVVCTWLFAGWIYL